MALPLVQSKARSLGAFLRQAASTPRVGRIPLSCAQEGLWFIDQLEGASTEYNLVDGLRVTGRLDRAALERAIVTIVSRHEILRTRFPRDDGQAIQAIDSTVHVPIADEDARSMDAERQRECVEAAIRREWDEPFDLARGPLLRVRVLRLGDADTVVLWTCHHIVSDGWSENVFNRELATLYAAYCEGAPNPLRPLSVQYADFSIAQRAWLDEATLNKGLAYWTEQLANLPERLALPTDGARPSAQNFTAARHEAPVAPALLSGIHALGRRHRTTSYMTFLTALAVLLARYSGQDDIPVGTPVANRGDPQLEELIGLFINTLVMRVRVDNGGTFQQLLQQVRRLTLEAYRHQHVPFDRIVEALAPHRTLSTSPLFQVLLVQQTVPVRQLVGVHVEAIRGAALRVRYDLEVHLRECGGAVTISWLYNDRLFDRWRIEQLARHYERVLEAMVANPAVAVNETSLLTPAERTSVLAVAATPSMGAPASTANAVPPVVREWWRRGMKRDRGGAALICGDRVVSYAALHARARRIASALRAASSDKASIVGILTDDREAMATAIVGALDAGLGFMPLDPGLPDERLRVMVEASAARVLLVDAHLEARARAWPDAVIVRLDDSVALTTSDADTPIRAHPPPAPAYVYFTSGSTGTPKGVAGQLRSVEHFISWEISALDLTDGVRVSQLTRPGFDPYLRDLFVAWGSGGTVCIPPDPDVMADGSALLRWLSAEQIEVVHCVPTVLRILLAQPGAADALPHLRFVLSAGEPLLPNDVSRWHRVMPTRTRLLNLYGPTETTLAKLAHWVTPHDAHRAVVPVGRAIPGASAIVLDADGDVCPFGVVGDIGITTQHGTLGYYRQPSQTAQAFVPHPFARDGDVLYLTGDLGRMLPDGTLECLGRRDRQVKIRGNRVELGEIESVLLEQAGVQQATVIADMAAGETRLVAYVVGDGDWRQWRRALQLRLPACMVPSACVRLDRLPLTRHGKVDRQALPPARVVPEAHREPGSSEEALLCDLFADVLEVGRVGLDDDLFALGGHSLMMARLIRRIQAVFEVELSIRELFAHPVVSQIFDRIQALLGRCREGPVLALRPAGNLLPLFCITSKLRSGSTFSALLPYIGRDHPIYALDAGWLRSRGAVCRSLQQVAGDCATQIRHVQPSGAYQLYGPGAGGTIAFDIARRLHADGNEVTFVAMLDSEPIIGTDPDPSLDCPVEKPFGGEVVLMTTDSRHPNGTRLVEAWKPFISGRITLCPIPATGPDTSRSERYRDVGAVLARALSACH